MNRKLLKSAWPGDDVPGTKHEEVPLTIDTISMGSRLGGLHPDY